MTKYYYLTTSVHDADGTPLTRSIKAGEVKTYQRIIRLQGELNTVALLTFKVAHVLGTMADKRITKSLKVVDKLERQLNTLFDKVNFNKYDRETTWKIVCLTLPDNVDNSKVKISTL